MRKIFIISVISIILCSVQVFAQQAEFGIIGGGSTYFGDLNTNTSFRLTKPMAGVYGRLNIDSRISFKLTASYASIEGNDRFADNYYQTHRNLSFRSPVYEIGTQLEFNFLDYSSNNPKFRYTPYFLIGLGLFSFDPIAVYNNAEYRLQPMGTEGQGYAEYPDKKPYKLTSPLFSIGGGFKYKVNKNFSLFFEAANRKVFTDYIDDVGGVYPDKIVVYNEGGPLAANLSDRSGEIGGLPVGSGNKFRADKKKDSYLFFGIGMSVTINKYKCPDMAIH